MQLFFRDHKKCTAWGGVSGWRGETKTNHIMGKGQTRKIYNPIEIKWATATY